MSNAPKRKNDRPHQFLGRVEREMVDGEVAEVRLLLLHPLSRVHINEGDEFVTLQLKTDPFKEIFDGSET